MAPVVAFSGSGSRLIAPAVYVGGLVVSNTAAALAPNMLAAVIMLAIWPTVSLFLFVVVTWFRDDDWLAAGFLIGTSLAALRPILWRPRDARTPDHEAR